MCFASQVRLNRPKSDRDKMYEILERFSEVLDRDLSAFEKEEMVRSLTEIQNNQSNQDLVHLADALINYLNSRQPMEEASRPNLLDRVRISFIKFEKRVLTRGRLGWIIPLGLIACGIWSMISPTLFLSVSRDALRLQEFMNRLITQNLVTNPASGLTWFEVRISLEGSLGALLIVSAMLVLFKAEKIGTWIGQVGLLVELTIVNLLVFYFDQFSTIAIAAFQFLVLVLVIRYRKRFLNKL